MGLRSRSTPRLGGSMTAKKLGRPQSDVMTAALKRVLAGETAYRVARDMGIRHEYLCKRVKLERNKPAPT